ncbi:MAG: glycosyltransferase [Actinobacteria bacterium]|uniref:Unannotated protein n=1 Tax=freshwater metagenome TaxID=449393 RepID=A0A6J7U575_9ZZZZ|nr:glycosyltransferase [Actinomycetota bacterium]MTA24294.1 glycosyltransferase [Actinomycetota bacterium]MTA46143.1 glycosyltransferase [Actinomycetota bacterium]
MVLVGTLLALGSLFLTLVNSLSIKKPSKLSGVLNSSVSVLIPMRNESENVNGVLTSSNDQVGLSAFEIITLNDGSTDNTSELISNFKFNMQAKAINGETLPLGWLGKNFACHQLSLASQSDYLVFIDADVRLSPSAIQSAIRTMQICNWDFISPYPAQIAITPIEQLIQPLLQWSWFATVPLYIAQKFRIRSMAVANGQFLIVSRAAYLKCGGHEAIKGEVIDDIELARLLLKSGFNGGVADGSAISNCRMYKSSAQLINGYRKSLWRAFGSPIGSIFAITLLTLSSIVPFIYALNGSILGWVGYMAITTSRLVTALKVKSRWETAFLHPLSIAALIALICWSWIGKMRGELKWRGRNV